jgi:catalase
VRLALPAIGRRLAAGPFSSLSLGFSDKVLADEKELHVPSESKSVPERIVDLMYKIAGSHPGSRPVHAKGLVCQGTFRASAEAPRMSRAEHLRGQPIPTTVRFANASGDPNVHDGQPNVRSMSVKLQVAGGKPADILANSIEGFVARTPEELLTFLEAQLPDPATGKPNPDAVPRFLESHPAAKAFIGRLMAKPIPASYAQATYHSENAFRFTAADGSSRFGRYHWVPEAGEGFLTPEVGSQRGPNFLREELAERLARGPAAFRLTLQVAADSDPTDDPTALWPADRRTAELGRLEIGSISPTSGADEQRLIFDPANVADGIELSADPILLARSPAYSVSYARRNPKV